MAGYRNEHAQGPGDARRGPYPQQPHHPHHPQQPRQPYHQQAPRPHQPQPAEPAFRPPDDGYDDGYGPGPGPDGEYDDHGADAGPNPIAAQAPPPGPKLRWNELLTGVVLRPIPTFWRMRDYPMWGPALVVSFLYGMLAPFGLEKTREETLDATVGTLVPSLPVVGCAMIISGLLLGTVTHQLARQLGGNGIWAPTVGLAILISALTDVPRLALAVFLGGGHPVVQVLGTATWLYAGLLFTWMVSRSHEIPWPKALAASALQLLALLFVIKLGTF
ncbi:Yip1 family protein [Streptomyces aidingensis]|uniref:Yip1 domain-containing protein n=1 Tax=Streptomyces aidingensis TaxID=910347 RepID=A0A1I1Q485_9ACTN|nr:Yip1 family protein [Streptomyces aidingensis]SFD16934.1 Yip1 domain-containing protein [Streptomyces aidingensis]